METYGTSVLSLPTSLTRAGQSILVGDPDTSGNSGIAISKALEDAACTPTPTKIKAIGAGGQTIDWKPSAADSSGNATWPQTLGNQISFTSGMWVYAAKSLTWNVQGTQCQTVDAAGLCH